MPPSAAAAAAREERRRKFAEELARAVKEDEREGGPSPGRKASKSTGSDAVSKSDTKQTQQTRQAGSSAAPAASSPAPPPTPRISKAATEDLTAFYLMNTKPSISTARLIAFFGDALFAYVGNPRLLLSPGTIVDHDLLRKLLVSDKPPRISAQQSKKLCEQLSMLGLHLAPKESVPSELQQLKEAYRLAALEEAPIHAEERDLAGIRIVLDELLRAHGEPEYPWDDLDEFLARTEPATDDNMNKALAGPPRRPELAKVVQEVVVIYIGKVEKAQRAS